MQFKYESLQNHSDRPSHVSTTEAIPLSEAPCAEARTHAALRIQMHLDGNLSVLQGDIVDERLVYIVHVVILRLQQKVAASGR